MSDVNQWVSDCPRIACEPKNLGRIVCTLNVGGDWLMPNARDSLREAARRWGANYMEIVVGTGLHHWHEKLFLDRHLADGYRIAYYDGDVLIRHDCPSPFEVVPAGHWGLVRNFHPNHAGTLGAVQQYLPPFATACGVSVDCERSYANSGLMLFELPAHRAVFDRARTFVERHGFSTNWVIADQGPLACALAETGVATFPIPPIFAMHGDCLWSGWTAEMKTWGYHFCGPISKTIGIANTCWKDCGPSRFAGDILRWHDGRPRCLMTGEITYLIRQLATVWRGVIVEVGTFLGGSAWFGAQIARDNWSEFHAVDTWSGASDLHVNDQHFKAFERNLRDADLDDCVIVHRKSSSSAAADFADESVDLVFIDADHSYEACLADICSWWPKLKFGGLMLGHDFVSRFGVPAAVREAFEAPDEISWGDWPIWCVRKTRGRSRII